MGTSTTSRESACAAAPGGQSGEARRPRLRQWLRASGGSAQGGAPAEHVEELEQEVALLREENARLRVARERTADRPVNERVRDLLPLLHANADADADDGDAPWELLTECMLMRDSLADACLELERGARELRRRLETLLPGSEGARPEALMSDDLPDAA